MDAWLELVKLDRGGREEMLATLDGPSTAVASTIHQHVVDRRLNSVRAADPGDPSLITPAAR
jgi:hypothetical protein